MDEIDNRGVMQFLIDNGANVNARDRLGFTPLHYAVLYRNHSIIDILFQAGADINSKSCLKRIALHFAISNHQHGHFKRTLPSDHEGPDMWMIRKLLDQDNILVNKRDIRGNTPLMWAVMDKQLEVVVELMKKDANPNIRNKDSLTPLHVALSAPNPCSYIVVHLLFNQASLNIEDKEGKTPIDVLIQNVRNAQCYQFAYTCLETMAFTHRIKKHQKQKLESVPQLSAWLENCSIEIMLMKLDYIANGFTVFHFMLVGANDSDFENPLLQVYRPIVKRLLAGAYSKYLYYILERIPKYILCLLFKIVIFEKDFGYLSDTDGCEDLLDDGCQKTSDHDDCEKTSDPDVCKKYSYRDVCDDTSNRDVCDDTSNRDVCNDTSNRDGCDDTSNRDGCDETSDRDGGDETSDRDGGDETSDNADCEDVSDDCEEQNDDYLDASIVNGSGVQECTKGNSRNFFSKIDIFTLSKYLSRLDVFCLIVALSKGKIPECMWHVRYRKYIT